MPKKTKSLSQVRKMAVELAKEIAKKRDRYICQKCGRSKRMGFKIDGSHVKAESHYHELSADPMNIKAMCFKCHDWWHLNPTESGLWFKKKFPDRHEYLEKEAKKRLNKSKKEWEQVVENLKKFLKKT